MENMQGEPCGPHLYLLSRDGYETLKQLQDMLTLMAHITYNDDNAENGDATITIGRAELYFIFEAINMKIDEVLERLGDENWLGVQSQTEQ
ncbi:XAC0095 family protein [Dyella nitratireducens]|uniref:XAC0095-like domain-containing protein n=1 Tax=Dyella nitratireducens TaxID=1849580 RepID=A0ABQ1FZL0_9GAMM|nr:hypothetical protein [Dyella nitratireducens]GGA33777.1 hypothetical protein GCM10010981_23410 [Dyella nitratireducens]GLQ40775.1 hypothetical protein GCM10007902_06250 [Dyella nitratireducens]